MSFKTLNIGATALMTSQLALNTVGHNVSNAATPGYTRQRLLTEAHTPDIKTFGALGSGVNVRTVRRVSDEFLERQVRSAKSLFNYLDSQLSTYENIQGIMNELTDNDLSTSFDDFWNSLADMANYVEDISTRRAFIEKGRVLSEAFNGLDDKLHTMREHMDQNVIDTVTEVNGLIEEIARLNVDIVKAEKAGLADAIANDSRDQREVRIQDLSEILDITVTEESNGQVVVTYRGRLMVFEDQYFELETENVLSSEMMVANVVFKRDGEELNAQSGRLAAFMELRDQTILGYKDDLDRLAGTFLWEFNRLHSQGQGLVGYDSLQSSNTVLDPLDFLDDLDHEFSPLSDTFDIRNGNFEVVVHNEVTGELTELNIEVDLDNTGEPDTILYHNTAVDQYGILDNYNLTGLQFTTNTGPRGELFLNVTDLGGGNYQIQAYSDAARTVLVADSGAVAVPGGVGTVTMNEAGGSGIFGTIDLDYTQAGAFGVGADNTIVAPDLFNNSLVSKLETTLEAAFPGSFQVTVDPTNRITIDSVSENFTFSFGKDTSGVLAALGFNTFFSGYDAGTIAVDSRTEAAPELVAGASTFEPGDNSNVVELLKLREGLIFNNDASTTDDYYQGIIGRLGVEYAQKESLLETQEDILLRAQNQREALSGVNMDEELTLMIQFQRTFQSAARFISTANAVYESLINM